MKSIGAETHVLVVPFSAQGHIMPMLKLSYSLADQGLKVTFLIPEKTHAQLIDSQQDTKREVHPHLRLVTIPDVVSPEHQTDLVVLYMATCENYPSELEKVIEGSSDQNRKFACVIADELIGVQLHEVSRKMGIPRLASYCVGSAATKAFIRSIPKLIETGVIDEEGTPKQDGTIIWSSAMPGVKPNQLIWRCMGAVDPGVAFQLFCQGDKMSESVDWVLCSTFHELEPAAITVIPNLLPVGSLPSGNQPGNLLPEDWSCLSWLDQQTSSSVIYLAFGSTVLLSQCQFDELALGLELLGQPFLWVVRSDYTYAYPDGFRDRVSRLGKMISWAPQEEVLSHPSVACFVSHCGFNSVMDGVSRGVPFICWPQAYDQFINETSITDDWRIGLRLDADEDGLISRNELKKKVEQLLGDEEIKKNSLKLKELAIKSTSKDGSSTKNLQRLVEDLKKTSAHMTKE